VIATHNPLVGLGGIAGATLFQTKLALYTSYVIAGRVAHGVVPDALWWDTADPYRFLRVEPHRDHDVVIFGGEDHKTGQQEDTEPAIDASKSTPRSSSGRRIHPSLSGQVVETPDGLPYIGRSADHQYSATGYAGNGLTFGTLAGIMIFNLPYFTADMKVERRGDGVDYASTRRSREHAEFKATYEPVSTPFVPGVGSVEYFLTERYCLYHHNRHGHPYRLEIHHRPWSLQLARATITMNTMAAASHLTL
jgi:hypothetical protein